MVFLGFIIHNPIVKNKAVAVENSKSTKSAGVEHNQRLLHTVSGGVIYCLWPPNDRQRMWFVKLRSRRIWPFSRLKVPPRANDAAIGEGAYSSRDLDGSPTRALDGGRDILRPGFPALSLFLLTNVSSHEFRIGAR